MPRFLVMCSAVLSVQASRGCCPTTSYARTNLYATLSRDFCKVFEVIAVILIDSELQGFELMLSFV
jgi:hypothetical protein